MAGKEEKGRIRDQDGQGVERNVTALESPDISLDTPHDYQGIANEAGPFKAVKRLISSARRLLWVTR